MQVRNVDRRGVLLRFVLCVREICVVISVTDGEWRVFLAWIAKFWLTRVCRNGTEGEGWWKLKKLRCESSFIKLTGSIVGTQIGIAVYHYFWFGFVKASNWWKCLFIFPWEMSFSFCFVFRRCFGPDLGFLRELFFFFDAQNVEDFSTLVGICRLLLQNVQDNGISYY